MLLASRGQSQGGGSPYGAQDAPLGRTRPKRQPCPAGKPCDRCLMTTGWWLGGSLRYTHVRTGGTRQCGDPHAPSTGGQGGLWCPELLAHLPVIWESSRVAGGMNLERMFPGRFDFPPVAAPRASPIGSLHHWLCRVISVHSVGRGVHTPTKPIKRICEPGCDGN